MFRPLGIMMCVLTISQPHPLNAETTPNAVTECSSLFQNQRITQKMIHQVLKAHALWIKDSSDSRAERANLCQVDLGSVDLREVDLSGANLRGANLTHAESQWARLS